MLFIAYSGILSSWLDKILGSVKGGSVSGTTITLVKHDNTEITLTTQDTTYSDFVGSGASAAHGLVPAPSTTAGTVKFLREDGSWETPAYYTHPTTSGNKHIPSGGSSGQILRWSADGTAVWGNELDPVYSVVTSSANGLMSKEDKAAFDTLMTAISGATAGQVLVKTANGYAFDDLANISVNPTGV